MVSLKGQCWATCYLFCTPQIWYHWLKTAFVPHLYADDTRVNGSYRPVEIDTCTLKLSGCVGVISNWVRSNRRQLNSKKTEVIWCTTGQRQHQLPTNAQSIEGVQVALVTSVRNFDLFLDANLVMQIHVQWTVSGCFAVLNCGRSATPHQLPRSLTLVVALVRSRMDYG